MGNDQLICTIPRLSAKELAHADLPSHTFPSKAYLELFNFDSNFTDAVESLESAGELPIREDHSYRLWDLYQIISRVVQHTNIVVEGTKKFVGSLRFLDHSRSRPLPDQWWQGVEAVRRGWQTAALRLANYRATGKAEGKVITVKRLDRFAQALEKQLKTECMILIEDFPSDPDFWRRNLRSHAQMVIALRRLASDQLTCCAWLAEMKLQMDRRGIRALVGKISSDLRAPALTVASFSNDTKALDLAADAILAALPDYNAKIRHPFRLTEEETLAFLTFLQRVGLQHWYTELSIVGWQEEGFLDYSDEQRASIVYGRVRTLAVLLEEALVAMAEDVGDPSLFRTVSESGTLAKKLNSFMNWPKPSRRLVVQKKIDDMNRRYNIFSPKKPPIPPNRLNRLLSRSLRGYGIHAGNPPSPIQRPVPERILAGLVFIRNLTSHRFPVPVEGRRSGWFDVWSKHLPAINRTILWGALALWKMKCHYRNGI